MAEISQEKLREILQNAPPGTTQEGIVAGLKKRGHTFQGEEELEQRVPSETLLEKTGRILDSIFGGGEIGEAIGTKIAKLTVPKEQRQFVSSGPTGRQIAGDIGQIGLTLGTLGGLGAIGGLGARALKTGAIGAGFGATGALKGGEPISEIPGRAISGAVLGAGIPVAGAGLSALTQKLPTRLIRSVLKQPKKALIQGRDVAQHVLNKKKIGTANKLLTDSEAEISRLSEKINIELGKKKMAFLKNEVLSDTVDNINQAGGATDAGEVREIIDRLAPQARKFLNKKALTLSEGNKLRQSLDRTLGDKGFLIGQLPFNKSVLRSFDNALRNKVQSLAPETKIPFRELSKEITFRDALLDSTTQASRNQIVTFGDLFGAGIGGFGGLPGVAAGVAIRRGIQSTPFLTASAVGLKQADKLRPILEKLAPAERTFLLKQIGRED